MVYPSPLSHDTLISLCVIQYTHIKCFEDWAYWEINIHTYIHTYINTYTHVHTEHLVACALYLRDFSAAQDTCQVSVV